MEEQRHTADGAPRALADYQKLVAQKRTLQEVVRVTESVERLNSGLQAAVLMGKPTNLIQQKALRYFQDLSESTRLQPSPKLRATLDHLEQRMRASMEQILALAAAEQERGLSEVHDEDSAKLINDFRRTSQTAVALRIVLRERGEPTKPSPLPVEQGELRSRIEAVSAREKECRVRVVKDIRKIQGDAQGLLGNKNLPPPMRIMVENMVEEMQENLDHIRAGRSIEKLPHPVEVIELAEEFSANSAPPPRIRREVQAGAAQPGAANPDEHQGGGFFGRLNDWLNTPWNVGWKEIKKREQEEARRAAHGKTPAAKKPPEGGDK